jgi:hypothetical protein
MQTALFINWHIGHGSRWKDWQHAWRNWMLKALKDNRWNLNRAGAASPASNSRPLFIPSRAEAASIQAKGLTVEEWADHNGYRI